MNITEKQLLGNPSALTSLLLYHVSLKFIPLNNMKPGILVPMVLLNKTMNVTL
jgi:hypothetical protein